MRKAITFAALLFIATSAEAAPFSVGTGTAAWQVAQTAGVSNNGAALNTQTSAVVETGLLPFLSNFPGLGADAWTFALPGSAWVGQLTTDGNVTSGGCPACGANPGTYVYSLAFAPGPFGGNVSFRFTADNYIATLTVVQGASVLFNYVAPNTNNIQNALIDTGNINFGAGSNVLIAATVINQAGARDPSGFLVSGIGNTNSVPVPEPSTVVLLGLGMTGLVAARRLRK